MVGDCRRNLVGRCAESSLVCPQEREARERFLFALSDNGIVHVFIGASQHASNGSVGARDAEYQCGGIGGLDCQELAVREVEKGVASRGMSRNTYLGLRFPVEQTGDMSV